MSSADRPAAPSVALISDALAALGVYAEVPSGDDLEQQAVAAGGELVLAAALANALYGAAIGTGMLAEGHMLEHPDAGAEHLSFARSQVLRASGATGPAAIGVMHWQAAHIAQPMRAWAEGDRLGPLGSAAAAAAWALTLILDSFSVTDPDDPRAANLLDTLAEAGEQLAAASAHLHRMSERAIDLASELAAVIAAASDDIAAAGNGHPPTHD